MKLNRNDSCHCGSGKKYKRCCLFNDEKQMVSQAISQSSKASKISPEQDSLDNAITATLTGEYTQPVRLCYKVYDKPAIRNTIFKNMKCMSYDSSSSRWLWLLDHEAKHLAFKKSYKDIPKHLNPIIIGSFFIENDDEVYLDVRSHERAVHAIEFFDRYIPRNIAEITDAIVLGHIITRKESPLLSDFNNFFKNVTIVDKAKEFDEMLETLENSTDKIDNQEFALSFLANNLKKSTPDVQRMRTHYYEEGIDSFRRSLQFNQFAALNKANGKELTSGDIINRMFEAQSDIDHPV